MINAGRLRHRIKIMRRAAGVDSVGQPSTTFTELAQDWAEVSQPGGREFFNAQHFVDEVTVLIKMRYRSDLNARDRIDLPARSQSYEVVQVLDPDMRGRELLVGCKEVVA